MNRLIAICASAVLLCAMGAASAAVPAKRPLATAPAALRQAPARPVCLVDQGAVAQPGDTSWISRASDGTTHDCTPYACNVAAGTCRTKASNTNECRSGLTWWANDNSCSPCGPDNYMDDATHTCKQSSHLGG